MNKGFTLIEILIVIAIVAILAAATTPFLSRFILVANFDSTSDRFIGSIRKAQAHAMDGRNNETWGICRLGNAVRVYSGSCAGPTLSEDFSIPTTIAVSNFSDTTFNSRSEPSQPISVVISTSIESISIEVNAAGGIQIN